MSQDQGAATPVTSDAPFLEEDTSRISITALHTGYVWYKHGLSDKAFSTTKGRVMYASAIPWMMFARHILGISDLETGLLQRHLMIDHLLKKAIAERGVGQVLEIACGLSPRGFRLKQDPNFRDLLYVEADLPDMARRKKTFLENAGLKGDKHYVVPINILATSGEMSLEHVARKYLKPDFPTAVITEGMVYYFDFPTMGHLWNRIGTLLNEFNGGVYLSDNLPHHKGFFYYPLLKMWQGLVGLVARGRMHMHFSSDQEAESFFNQLAFTQTHIHRPETFYDRLPIPRTRQPGLLRIIEAGVLSSP